MARSRSWDFYTQTKRPRRQQITLTAAGCLIVIALLAPLPFLLNGRLSDSAVIRVANIGQAFGIASAIMSALALGFVALSLIYQGRQTRDLQAISWRDAHEGLVRMVMDEPELLGPCMIDYDRFDNVEQARQYLFTTLWLAHARVGLRTGFLTETDLRDEICGGMFHNETGRQLWRLRWDVLASRGGVDYFTQVVNEEYDKVMAQVPGANGTDDTNAGAQPPRD